jgi:catalase-peroxidase
VVDGQKILINDRDNPNAIKAYKSAKTRPFISGFGPSSGELSDQISFSITNGDTKVDQSSISLSLDGASLAPLAITTDGDTIEVTYQNDGFLAGGNHEAVLTYVESSTPPVTRSVSNVFQPTPIGKILTSTEEDAVRNAVANTGLSIQELVNTAWASASTFRGSDNRGGANGARIRLEPQKNWNVNKPEELSKVLAVYEKIAAEHGTSIADVIIIGGAVGIEKAGGQKVAVTTGRGDATQEATDIDSFNLLKPRACGFRNYAEKEFAVSPEEIMLDKAQLLGLTPVEMTLLVGGLRAMGVSHSGDGVWTDGTLDNSWFKTLLSMDVKWETTGYNSYVAKDRTSGAEQRTASRTDLVFGSNSELRAIAEVYAQNDNNDKFVQDFIKAWNKVMNADRFDLQ